MSAIHGACNAIADKTVAKPRPPKLSPYKLNANKTKLAMIPHN